MGGVIARGGPDFRDTGRFSGVGHQDGMPSVLGRALWQIFQGKAARCFSELAGNTRAMSKYLIDECPTGWGSIIVADECYCDKKEWLPASRRTKNSADCRCLICIS